MTAWDALSNILTHNVSLLALGVLVVVAITLIKLNLLSISIKGVHIGQHSQFQERYILIKQAEFVRNYVLGKENELFRRTEGTEKDKYYIRWVLERVIYYIIVNWVMLNKITLSETEISSRTETLRHFVVSLPGKPENLINKMFEGWCKECLEGLYRIRHEKK